MRVLVTGGTGFLGSHVMQRLKAEGHTAMSTSRDLGHDLRDPEHAQEIITRCEPDAVIHLAANVGGIGYNQQHPADICHDNLMMGCNVVKAAHQAGAKLVYVGTVCSYPKHCPTPFTVDNLYNGYPEETNAPYGIAKRAIIELIRAYHQQYGMKAAVLIPTNLYGPGDNFDPESSHVIPSLIRKFDEAQRHGDETVTLWGTGNATREFLYVEDAADAVVMALANTDDPKPQNVGTGEEISIEALANLISSKIGYRGRILWDATKPDGQPRRLVEPFIRGNTSLYDGLRKTINWWRAQQEVTA